MQTTSPISSFVVDLNFLASPGRVSRSALDRKKREEEALARADASDVCRLDRAGWKREREREKGLGK